MVLRLLVRANDLSSPGLPTSELSLSLHPPCMGPRRGLRTAHKTAIWVTTMVALLIAERFVLDHPTFGPVSERISSRRMVESHWILFPQLPLK